MRTDRLTLRQRTLHYETYFMPAPEENVEALYDYLLRTNTRLYAMRFAIGLEDAVYLGSRIRVGGSTTTGHRILLDLGATQRLDVGEVVSVRLDLEKVHVLNKEDS